MVVGPRCARAENRRVVRSSRPGEHIRLTAVTPPGPAGSDYPAEFRSRRQVFRAYGTDGAIVGGELVEAGTGQEDVAERLLGTPGVAFVQSRNVVYGCYMFTMRPAEG